MAHVIWFSALALGEMKEKSLIFKNIYICMLVIFPWTWAICAVYRICCSTMRLWKSGCWSDSFLCPSPCAFTGTTRFIQVLCLEENTSTSTLSGSQPRARFMHFYRRLHLKYYSKDITFYLNTNECIINVRLCHKSGTSRIHWWADVTLYVGSCSLLCCSISFIP